MKRVKGLLRLDVIAGAAVIAAVAIAVPALGSDPDVTAADEPSGTSDEAYAAPPAPPPMLTAADREQLDEAVQCMADKGFGAPTPDAGDGEGRGLFISREEADDDAFRQAAEECELPPPPTDAQIRAIGCSDGVVRDERSGDDGANDDG